MLLLKVSENCATFNRRGFTPCNYLKQQHLETIGKNFLKGYNLSLKLKGLNLESCLLNSIESEFCGFAFEGAAMAKTILDEISFFKKTRIIDFLNQKYGNKHIYMIHVGIGWGYAKLYVNIEKEIESFDPILRWLIIDGYGFHQAYFKTKEYVYNKQQPTRLKKQFSRNVFFQGVGRCLWFIEGADPYRIYDRINTFPEIYKADLWSGVGLACTYAGGVNEQDIVRIRALSDSRLPHLMQGALFAAKARDRAEIIVPHTEMACRIICGISVQEATAICDECLSKVPVDIPSEEKYEMWRSLIRSSICKSSQYERVSEEIIN